MSDDMVNRLREATFSKSTMRGGIIGQTIEAAMRSTFHEVSAYDLHEAAEIIERQAAAIQAARIEGARMALEAALSTVKILIGADLSGSDCRDAGEGYDYAIDDAMEQIRALDPAIIAKDASE
jgi:hypothetical protein